MRDIPQYVMYVVYRRALADPVDRALCAGWVDRPACRGLAVVDVPTVGTPWRGTDVVSEPKWRFVAMLCCNLHSKGSSFSIELDRTPPPGQVCSKFAWLGFIPKEFEGFSAG